MSPKARKTKKALIVWGGWGGHTPKECAERFAPWLESKGFKVTISDTLDAYLDKRRMKSCTVIIPIWTMGTITREQSQALRDTVAAGCGLAGWHGGMCDSFRQDVAYQFMTGGQWVAHPGGVVRYTVDSIDQKDPITRGLRPFRMKSEQYYMHTDPGNKTLAYTTFSGRHQGVTWIRGVKMPVVWTRVWGKGRVFFTSLGHVNNDFDVPEAFEIAKRGIMWAAREPIVPEYTSPKGPAKKAAKKK